MAVKKTKLCVSCQKEKTPNSFYSSTSSLFMDGKVPVCKKCISEQVDENDISTVKRILRQIDKPFIFSLWQTSVNSDKDTFGNYMKNINSLPQYRKMTYEDSVDEVIKEDDVFSDGIDESNLDNETILQFNEMKAKFGAGYKKDEYLRMEKFYNDMMSTHDINSPQHKEMLIEICKVNVQKDRALSENNINDYKKLSDAFKTLIADSGFRPADRVTGSEATGIRTFSQIFEEIEKDGFIVPVPIQEHQDIVDRTIMYILNYQLKLLNMDVLASPPSDTPQVDDFYDDEEDYY